MQVAIPRGSGIQPPVQGERDKNADGLAEVKRFFTTSGSQLGQLIRIAASWNPASGRYEQGVPEHLTSSGTSDALARWHRACFVQWLSMPLEEKHADLVNYWNQIGGDRSQISRIRSAAESAIPPLTRSVEQQHFLQELGFIQALLNHSSQ